MSSTHTEARLTPKSPNYLRNNNFKFTINKIPNVNFYVQSCNLPSLELGYRETKSQFAHPVQINGGELTYGTFNISFIVDEDLVGIYSVEEGFPRIVPSDLNDIIDQRIDVGSYEITMTGLDNFRIDYGEDLSLNLLQGHHNTNT